MDWVGFVVLWGGMGWFEVGWVWCCGGRGWCGGGAEIGVVWCGGGVGVVRGLLGWCGVSAVVVCMDPVLVIFTSGWDNKIRFMGTRGLFQIFYEYV